MTKADPCSGVKCFTIGGRMVEERQRCLGMTDEERRWRAQWLKDQVLSKEEPKFSIAYYKETTNVFRRLYKTPMLLFERALAAKFGPEGGAACRYTIGKIFIGFASMCYITYIIKYHANDFVTGRTVEFYKTRSPMYPNEKDYPNYQVKKIHEYYDQGFYSSVLAKKV